MKKVIIFILLFIFNLSFAHKDRIEVYKKKLVEIRMTSSYEYGAFNKLKVYGDYANEIVRFNNFKDSIIINFKYSYNNYYNSGNEVNIKYDKFRNNKYLKIDIINNELTVQDFSKIVDLAIKNKNNLKKLQIEKLDYDMETNNYVGKHLIINPEILNEYLYKENKFINELNLKVEIFKNEFFSCFWNNNSYEYYQKDKTEPIYSIKDYELYSNQLTELGLVIFPNHREFFFIDNDGEISKKHELECSDNVFYFAKRGEYFWVFSHRMGQFYYLPLQDKLLKEVN